MAIVIIIGVLLGLGYILSLVDTFKDYLWRTYDYSLYNAHHLFPLLISEILGLMASVGFADSIVNSNTIHATIIADLILIFILYRNIRRLSFVNGILATVIQAIASLFIIILLFTLHHIIDGDGPY